MLVWSAILFTLGITAFLDSLYNYGEIFRQVNSVLFLLVSLGLLIRTTTKMRLRTMEHHTDRIRVLEEELHTIKNDGSAQERPATRAAVRA